VRAISLVVLILAESHNYLPPPSSHVVITGGSKGLGLALAQLYVNQGARVTIMARNQTVLDVIKLSLHQHFRRILVITHNQNVHHLDRLRKLS
jgi:short-subunit dehydrogenase